MHVLVVYAHPSRDSFTHALLEQVVRGLDDGPHTYEVNDLYASAFDPVFTERDLLQFLHEGLPEERLKAANPGQVVPAGTRRSPRSRRPRSAHRSAAEGGWRSSAPTGARYRP